MTCRRKRWTAGSLSSWAASWVAKRASWSSPSRSRGSPLSVSPRWQLELRYVALPELIEETVTLPVTVNVVPGSEAAGRVPNPTVRTELVYQRSQSAKRTASQHLQDGDIAGATGALREALGDVTDSYAAALPELADDLRQEMMMLSGLIDEATGGSTSRASKMMTSDAALKSRNHGRMRPTEQQ